MVKYNPDNINKLNERYGGSDLGSGYEEAAYGGSKTDFYNKGGFNKIKKSPLDDDTSSGYDRFGRNRTNQGLGSPTNQTNKKDDDDDKDVGGIGKFFNRFFGAAQRAGLEFTQPDRKPKPSIYDRDDMKPIDIDAQMKRIDDAVNFDLAKPLPSMNFKDDEYAGSTYDEVQPLEDADTYKARRTTAQGINDTIKGLMNTEQRQTNIRQAVNKTIESLKSADANVPYVIQAGDTLSDIAAKTGTTVQDLVKTNNIKDKNKIYTGNELIVPTDKTTKTKEEVVNNLVKDSSLRITTRGDEDPDAQFYQSFTQGITPKSMTQQTGAGKYESPDDMTELEILARTIEKEAEGESKKGKLAVGATIKNRVDKQSWMGKDIKSVILKRGQFSPWNSYTDYAEGRQGKDMLGESAKPSKDSYEAAKKILSGDYIDPTGGATHFVNPKEKEDVSWYEPFVQNKPLKIGNHQFGSPDDPTWDLQSSPRPKTRPLGRP